MKFQTARLDQLCEILGGGTPSRQMASYFGHGTAWATPGDVTSLDGLYIAGTKEHVTDLGLRNSSAKRLPPGAVLLTSRATIGYTAVSQVPICTNQGFVNFICGPSLRPEFLAYWLRTQRSKMMQQAGGTTFKEISRGSLRKFEISYPSVAAQDNIIDLLTRAEGILRLRREAQRKAAELIPALFLDRFGDPASNPKRWPVTSIATVAEVQGGLQVTRSRESLPVERPYLRVANVHRGRLDLGEIKSIRMTEAELTRTSLIAGDLLFVEGHGNPEEVGRVAVWSGAIPDCVHQNHLIRARLDQSKILPEFASALLNSSGGRRSLLRAGKTTSGLSTISTKNVKDTPIPLPPLALQEEFVRAVAGLQGIVELQQKAALAAQATFNALLHSAFAP